MAGQLVTDRTGKFYFGGLHAEQYRISFHAPGYNDIEQIVDLMTSPVGLINPVLVRNKDSSEGRTNAVVDANVPAISTRRIQQGKRRSWTLAKPRRCLRQCSIWKRPYHISK
jgi:hypothetical protein